MIARDTGLYGFGYFSEEGRLCWLSGLFTAESGPQRPRSKSGVAARFDFCTSCLPPFLAERFGKPGEKATKDDQGTPKLHENFILSLEETTAAARLVRLMRSHNTYWLKFFVLWLLQADGESRQYEVPIKQAEEMLADMRNLHGWHAFLEQLKDRCPAIEHHPAVAWVPKQQPAIVPEDDAEQFCELVRMWRIEHPEPEEPMKNVPRPAGWLGQSDGDED